jgi:hypothetical protein
MLVLIEETAVTLHLLVVAIQTATLANKIHIDLYGKNKWKIK